MEVLTENEKESVKRCEYACELLRKHNIPHKVCKKTIGHINLLAYVKGKTTLQPGTYIFLRTPKKVIEHGDNRGIQNCILSYQDFIRLENEEEIEVI